MPKQLFGVHGTYATALFQSAGSAGNLDKVEADLKNFVGHIDSNDAFRAFLTNPTIPRVSKKADIDAILAKGKFTPTTKAFFGTLAENGRLAETAKINEKFVELMNAHRGEVAAVVTSAEALSKSQLKTLEKSCASFLNKGESIKLEARVDPDILGGLTLQVGDRFMDLSISNKINKMHNMLSESV